jgi:protein phosphatase
LPVFALTNQNQRSKNEDSYQISVLSPQWSIPPITVLAVADGMGGHQYGEKASQETLQRFNTSLYEQLLSVTSTQGLQPYTAPQLTPQELAHYLEEAVKAANQRVYQIFTKNHWEGGSTLVVAAIMGNTAVVTNLGDSPLYHYCRHQDTLQELSEEHSVAGILLARGHISEEMAKHHMGRSQLQFFVGNDELPGQLPTQIVTLAAGDVLLLCSDGISNELSHADIQQILAQADVQNLENTAWSLRDRALAAQEDDNQTLILWYHQQPSDLQTFMVQPRQRLSQPLAQATAPTRPIRSPAASLAMASTPGHSPQKHIVPIEALHPADQRGKAPSWRASRPRTKFMLPLVAGLLVIMASVIVCRSPLFKAFHQRSASQSPQAILQELEAEVDPLTKHLEVLQKDLTTIQQELNSSLRSATDASSETPPTQPSPNQIPLLKQGLEKNQRILYYMTDSLSRLASEVKEFPSLEKRLKNLSQTVPDRQAPMMNRIQKLQQKINTLPQQREKLAQSVDGLTAKINRQLSPAKPAQSN